MPRPDGSSLKEHSQDSKAKHARYCRLATSENPTGSFPLRSLITANDNTPGVKIDRSTILEPGMLATNCSATSRTLASAWLLVSKAPLGTRPLTGGFFSAPGRLIITSMSKSISVCMTTHAGPGSLEARAGLCSRTRRIVLVRLGLLLMGDVMRSKPTTWPSRINSLKASHPGGGRNHVSSHYGFGCG